MEKIDTPSNSVLEVKLDYIQKDIASIKSDVKDIKNDFISRREFETQIKESEARSLMQISVVDSKIYPITKLLYLVSSAVVLAVIGTILKLVIK